MVRAILGLVSVAHASISGQYSGRVPGIVKIGMDFDSADTVKTVISVIGQGDINCPTEPYTATDSAITFSALGTKGDCFGDNIRTQGKDTTKFFIDINSDGSLNFHSAFAPVPLKLTKQSLAMSAISGQYSGRVPGIVKIGMDFDSADTVKTVISVIGQADINCPAEPYTATDSAITFSALGTKGDCFGDNIRTQGKDTSKFFIDINSDGSLNFHSAFAPVPLKLTKQSLAMSAISGQYSGRVPGIVKIGMDFDSADTVKTVISVIGQADINCPAEPYTATDSAITFSALGNKGDCFGDNIRTQGKDTTKFFVDINSDGSLNFHSAFAPVPLKLTKQSNVVLV